MENYSEPIIPTQQIDSISKIRWTRIGEWAEYWYFTEMCFEFLRRNALTEGFLFQGFTTLCVDSLWLYEQDGCAKWHESQRSTAWREPLFFRELANSIRSQIDEVERRQTQIIVGEKLSSSDFDQFEIIFNSLWSVFLADLGPQLGERAESVFAEIGLSDSEKHAARSEYLAVKDSLVFQQEQRALREIGKSVREWVGGKQPREVTYESLPEEIRATLARHAKRYGWLAMSDIDTAPPDVQYYLQQLLEAPGDRTELESEYSKEIESRIRGSDRELLEAIHELIFLDNRAADLFGELNFVFQTRLLSEHGVGYRDSSWYTWTELRNLVSTGHKLSEAELSGRKLHRVMLQDKGNIATYYGVRNWELVTQALRPLEPTSDEISFRGSVACAGVASGYAKILRTLADMEKVEKGDVVVATTTRPDLMPALRRCSAIVADSGGITSHAAIVARELKIPCIVGSKIATQVLRDGDRIEVDAQRGVVTILSRGGAPR